MISKEQKIKDNLITSVEKYTKQDVIDFANYAINNLTIHGINNGFHYWLNLKKCKHLEKDIKHLDNFSDRMICKCGKRF